MKKQTLDAYTSIVQSFENVLNDDDFTELLERVRVLRDPISGKDIDIATPIPEICRWLFVVLDFLEAVQEQNEEAGLIKLDEALSKTIFKPRKDV